MEPHIMRAKMQVESVTKDGDSENVKLRAVTGGHESDNSFAAKEPSATLEMQIDNPEAQGKLVEGAKFFVDFIPA